jgi:hypothetical protein
VLQYNIIRRIIPINPRRSENSTVLANYFVNF